MEQIRRLSQLSSKQWRDDVAFAAHALVANHKYAFHLVGREQLDRAVEELQGRLHSLAPYEIVIGLQALAAMIGDGHTFLATWNVQHRFPLEAHWFGQELRIVRTSRQYIQALGTQIVAINDMTIADVYAGLQQVIPQGENEWYVREQSARQVMCAEVLAALGITKTQQHAVFTFEPDSGSRFTLDVEPQAADNDWIEGAHPLPLCLQHPQEPFWFAYLRDTDTMYAHFRGYQNLAAHAQELFEAVDNHAPKRLVIDMRFNGGGNYTLTRNYLIPEIQNRPMLNTFGHLFILIGRGTFSAAMTNATDFRRETEALLVGEPTGARPNGYQENSWVTLPHSGLQLSIACRRYRFVDTDVEAVLPDILIQTSWLDYQAGRDPALEWVLSYPFT